MDYDGPQYYEYAALPPRSIRLLRLYPGHGHHGREGDIHVDLEVRRLGVTDFDALSYTWGPPTLEDEDWDAAQIFTTVQRCYPVYCEGRIIRVTKSLRDVLRRLRLFEIPSFGRYFTSQFRQTKSAYSWADGICINQEDNIERAQQVALMIEIYSTANLVLADIGDNDADTHQALEFVGNLYEIRRRLQGTRAPFGSLEIPQWWQQFGLQQPSPQLWWALVIFFSRSWFSRTWVVQEALLADGKKVVVLCGEFLTPLYQILQGIALIYDSQWGLTLFGMLNAEVRSNARYERHSEKPTGVIVGHHPYVQILESWAAKAKPSFYSLIRWLLPFTDCADPRDKIFATLGIASEFVQLDQRLLPIDYTKSTAIVFCHATKYVVDRSQNFDLLTTVARNPKPSKVAEDYELPSWCPDYHGLKESQGPLMGRRGSSSTCFSAAGSSCPLPIDFSQAWSIIDVCGVKVDEISKYISIHSLGQVEDFKTFLEFLSAITTGSTLPERSALMADVVRGERPHIHSDPMESVTRTILKYGANKHSDLQDPPITEVAQALFWILILVLSRKVWHLDHASDLRKLEATLLDVCRLLRVMRKFAVSQIDYGCYATFLWNELCLRKSCEGSRTRILHMLSTTKERIPGLNPDVLRLSVASSLVSRYAGGCEGRYLFQSTGGRIGMGAWTLREHDEIWLLAGSKVPFILRARTNGRYELVSEAYVDGAMFGELWPAVEEYLMNFTLD